MTEITDEIIQAARRADEDGLALYSDREIGVILAAVAPLIEAQARAEIERLQLELAEERAKHAITIMYDEKQSADHRALRAELAQARAAAIEECAKLCETHGWARDVEWWLKATKKEAIEVAAHECAAAIRALSRPVSEREGEKA